MRPKNNVGGLIYLNKNQSDKKKLILHGFENLGCVFIRVNGVPAEHGAFINLSQEDIHLFLCFYYCLYLCL